MSRRIDRVVAEAEDSKSLGFKRPGSKSYDPTRTGDRMKKRKRARERRPRPRRGSSWQQVFLYELAQDGCVTYACQAAGISRTVAYTTRQKDEEFALAWSDAVDESYEVLVKEAHRRALSGSDLLMIFLMKGLHPEVWRDNYRLPASVELDEQQLASMTSAITNAMVEANMSDAQKRAFRESLEDRLRVLEASA